jgi:transcriptional regulator with XRE-family HTH domain
MKNATEFGKMVRELLAKNNLGQEKLAAELNISKAQLSNYLTGKNSPTMDFLKKCTENFKLEKTYLAEFLRTAFLSSAEKKNKIVVDTRFIDKERIEMLSKVLSVIILYPKYNEINRMGDNIDLLYNALSSKTILKSHNNENTE